MEIPTQGNHSIWIQVQDFWYCKGEHFVNVGYVEMSTFDGQYGRRIVRKRNYLIVIGVCGSGTQGEW